MVDKNEIIQAFNSVYNRVSPNKSNLIKLMQEFNKVHEQEIYKEKDLTCPDCKNHMLGYWKTRINQWTNKK